VGHKRKKRAKKEKKRKKKKKQESWGDFGAENQSPTQPTFLSLSGGGRPPSCCTKIKKTVGSFHAGSHRIEFIIFFNWAFIAWGTIINRGGLATIPPAKPFARAASGICCGHAFRRGGRKKKKTPKCPRSRRQNGPKRVFSFRNVLSNFLCEKRKSSENDRRKTGKKI